MRFARRGHERVAMEDDYLFPPFPGQFVQALKEFQFLAGKEFIAKAACFAEHGDIAKDERARSQLLPSAEPVPQNRDRFPRKACFIQAHRAAPGDATALRNNCRNVGEKFAAWM